MAIQQTIPLERAVGAVLPHDICEIRTVGMYGETERDFKGTAFKKGHIIRPEDVEHLRRLGKEHIYVLQLGPKEIHEDEAAVLMATALAGPGTRFSNNVAEGKIGIRAAHDGLLRVRREQLFRFNMLGEVMCATLQDNTPVRAGEQVAATRLIPLVADRALVEEAVAIAGEAGPTIEVRALAKVRAGLVITGNEVFHGRVRDRFEPVLRSKLSALGSEVAMVRFAPDEIERIADEIRACLAAGCDLIVTSGGMSVDPDDVTRHGILAAGAEDVVYGSPVLPGAMFLVGRIGEVPVLGLPACGMFHRFTVFDLILPRVLTGERIGRAELAALGHGGLCRTCKVCQYPVCSFGK